VIATVGFAFLTLASFTVILVAMENNLSWWELVSIGIVIGNLAVQFVNLLNGRCLT